LQRWLVVADAPLDRYGAEAINRGLSDFDWVARSAVAHEAVVESFIDAAAVLPMKLFTIFTSDQRAIDYLVGVRARIDRVLARVAGHLEWGVRVTLDRTRAVGAATPRRPASGTGYLAQKKAQRDATAELVKRARGTVARLYRDLEAHASQATRRAQSDLPVKGGPLLLDAAFLVSRGAAGRFRATAARSARELAPKGYDVTLTGPWPAYSFVGE
jgi:hypothetical protein